MIEYLAKKSFRFRKDSVRDTHLFLVENYQPLIAELDMLLTEEDEITNALWKRLEVRFFSIVRKTTSEFDFP
jgi:hypothetical protein